MSHRLFVAASVVSVLMLVAFAVASWHTLSELRTQGASAQQNVSTAVQRLDVVSAKTHAIESKSAELDLKIREMAAKSDKQLHHEMEQLKTDLVARTNELMATNKKVDMLEISLNAKTIELMATTKKADMLEISLNAKTIELTATTKKVDMLEKQVASLNMRKFDSFATRQDVEMLGKSVDADLMATRKRVDLLEKQVASLSVRKFDSFATRIDLEMLGKELKAIDERTSTLAVERLKDGQKVTRFIFPGGYLVADTRGFHFYGARGEPRGNILIQVPMK